MLADLDELVLKCRDKRALANISEAVKCYKAGAYRSAIVAAWIAVAFDIIEKLRQLALSGDKDAEQRISEFETIRRQHNVSRALVFEKELLSLARDNFELISPLEYVDLERLQDDRNRCAHPSMNSDTDIFSPPAELARLHIRSVVDHLLCQEPAQGKYALDRLLVDVRSAYFPTKPEDAISTLSNSPLKRARKSLARNFLIVLIKELLQGEPDFRAAQRLKAACLAVKNLHFDVWEDVLTIKLSELYRSLTEDSALSRAIAFLDLDPSLWAALEPDVQNKLVLFVENLPSELIDNLVSIFLFQPLFNAATTRGNNLTAKEIQTAWFVDLPAPIANNVVKHYTKAISFEDANKWGKVIQTYASDFSPDHVQAIIEATDKNGQISGSFEHISVVHALRKAKRVPEETINALLRDNNLERLIPEDLPF